MCAAHRGVFVWYNDANRAGGFVMPSPFPGMDPFVESQHFSTLHGGMIFGLQETLQNRLPAGYFAAAQERVWIDTPRRWIEPDIFVRKSSRKDRTKSTAAATATLS